MRAHSTAVYLRKKVTYFSISYKQGRKNKKNNYVKN